MYHLRALKREALAKRGEEANFTVDSPIPYSVQELLDRLQGDNTQMVEGTKELKQGDFFGKLSRFIARLESKIEDQRLAFMFSPPESTLEWNWLDKFFIGLLSSRGREPGIKIIDLSHVPSDW